MAKPELLRAASGFSPQAIGRKMANRDLTAEYLRRHFSYNPATGTIHRIRNPYFEAWTVLRPIGCAHKHTGYLEIAVGEQKHLAHRLAWLHTNGRWPRGTIDHINGIKTDNRLSNLRDASHRMNRENIKGPAASNQCGFLGVRKSGKRWAATIGSKGVTYRLGTFETPEAANAAYLKAKRRLHKGCTI